MVRAFLEHGMRRGAAGKALVLGSDLPPGASTGGPLSPVLPARCRGDRLRQPAGRRRGRRRAAAHPRGRRPSGCARSRLDGGRAGYLEELAASAGADVELAAEDRPRVGANPLRTFDSEERARGHEGGRPRSSTDSCRGQHFASVRDLLDHAGVALRGRPTLVRGLDYYTRTASSSSASGSGPRTHSAVAGATTVCRSLGGPPLPAAASPRGSSGSCWRKAKPSRPGRRRIRRRRREGGARWRSSPTCATRARGAGPRWPGVKGQMREADRSGPVRGDRRRDGGAPIRDMRTGDQQGVEPVRRGNRRA